MGRQLSVDEEERVKAIFSERRGLAVTAENLDELLRVLGVAPQPHLIEAVLEEHKEAAPADEDDDCEVLLEIKVLLRLVEAHKAIFETVRREKAAEARARDVACVSDLASEGHATIRHVLRDFCLLDATLFEDFTARFQFISDGAVEEAAAAAVFDLLGSEPHPVYPRQRLLRIPTYLDKSLPIFQATGQFFERAREAHPDGVLTLDAFTDLLQATHREDLDALGQGRLIPPTAVDHFFELLHGAAVKDAAFGIFRAMGAIVPPEVGEDEHDAAKPRAKAPRAQPPPPAGGDDAVILSRMGLKEAPRGEYALYVTPKLMKYCACLDAGRTFRPPPAHGDPMRAVLMKAVRPERKIGLAAAFYEKLRGMVVMRYRDQQLMADFKTHHAPKQHASSQQPLHERVVKFDEFEQAMRDFFSLGRGDGLLEASSSEDDEDVRRARVRSPSPDDTSASSRSSATDVLESVPLGDAAELLEWFFPSAATAAVELFQSTGIPVESLDFPSATDAAASASPSRLPQRKGSAAALQAHRPRRSVAVGEAGVPFPAGSYLRADRMEKAALARSLKLLRKMVPDRHVARLVEQQCVHGGGIKVDTYVLITTRIRKRLEAGELDARALLQPGGGQPQADGPGCAQLSPDLGLLSVGSMRAAANAPYAQLTLNKMTGGSTRPGTAATGATPPAAPLPPHILFPRRWGDMEDESFLASLPLIRTDTPPEASAGDDAGSVDESGALLTALTAYPAAPHQKREGSDGSDDSGGFDPHEAGYIPGPWPPSAMQPIRQRRRRRVVGSVATPRQPVLTHPPHGLQFQQAHTNRVLAARQVARDGPRGGFQPPKGGWVEPPRDSRGRLLPATKGAVRRGRPLYPPPDGAATQEHQAHPVLQRVYGSAARHWAAVSTAPRPPIAPLPLTARPHTVGGVPLQRPHPRKPRPPSPPAPPAAAPPPPPLICAGRLVSPGDDAGDEASPARGRTFGCYEHRPSVRGWQRVRGTYDGPAPEAPRVIHREYPTVAGRVRVLLGCLLDGNRKRYRAYLMAQRTTAPLVVALAGAGALAAARLHMATMCLQRVWRRGLARNELRRRQHNVDNHLFHLLREDAQIVLARWVAELHKRWDNKGTALTRLAERRGEIRMRRASLLLQSAGRGYMTRAEASRGYARLQERRKHERAVYDRQRQRQAQVQIASNYRRRKWQAKKDAMLREIDAMRDREAAFDRAAVCVQKFCRQRLARSAASLKHELRAFDRLDLPPRYRS